MTEEERKELRKKRRKRKRLIRRLVTVGVFALVLGGLIWLILFAFLPKTPSVDPAPLPSEDFVEVPDISDVPADPIPMEPIEPDPDVNGDHGRFFYSNPYVTEEARTFADLVVTVAQGEPKDPYEEDGSTKYGALFGDPYAQWCAEFVMWCLRDAETQMGVSYTDRYYPWEFSGYRCVKWYREQGWFMERTKTVYRPRRGDVILFDYDFDGNCDHTGLVTGLRYDRDTQQIYVQTIEGNILDDPEPRMIRERELLLTTDVIYGYGTFYQ